ncbi:MAG: hypothetical protein ACRDDE_05895 [Paraclostridium sp.]|uniref:hypothetical protein n=1 Tax=Paraclostridium sp. TaxID=2023273 RepID=UPI003EE629CD
MQCTDKYTLDSELFDNKKITDGFFSNFQSVSSFIFALIPPIIAWFVSKDFKIMIITLFSCLVISVFYTANKNIMHNKKLLKKVQDELIKSNTNVLNLESILIEKENELSKIKNNLEFIKSNRDELIKMVENYRYESNNYENYYTTAKLGVKAIIGSHRITKDKEAILKLFEDIENGNRKDVSSE